MELSETVNIVSLPEDLLVSRPNSVQLYNYRLQAVPSFRNKVSLTTHVFSFLVEGTKEVVTDAAPIKISSDHFVLMKSGNCLMVEHVSLLSQNYKSILLFFSEEMLARFIEKYGIVCKAPDKGAPATVFEYDPYLKDYVKSLERLIGKKESQDGKLPEVKFEEVMLYLTQKMGVDFLSLLLTNYDDRDSVFLDVVQNNRLTKLSLLELAFLCNMSLSSFKRTFVRYFKITPSKWFLDQRLEHAKYLLVTRRQRPSDIFEKVGYENLSNFIQAFKKKYGLTPKQFQL
jgi:AraC-like DNA-binding protein